VTPTASLIAAALIPYRAMKSKTPSSTYPVAHLHEFITRVFGHYGLAEADAHQAAEILTLSDLRGSSALAANAPSTQTGNQVRRKTPFPFVRIHKNGR
jgi:hypothetical protein